MSVYDDFFEDYSDENDDEKYIPGYSEPFDFSETEYDPRIFLERLTMGKFQLILNLLTKMNFNIYVFPKERNSKL